MPNKALDHTPLRAAGQLRRKASPWINMTTIEILLALLGIIGIGSILANAQVRRKELEFKALEHKEQRYRSCILYMDVYFNPSNIKYLSSRQPDIHEPSDVIEYLRAEYHEMILYAGKPVVLSVKAFIDNPDRERFLSAIIAMRQDLWNLKSDLTPQEITLKPGEV